MDADYIVIGAGSAGCTVAARLSEDSGRTVMLLEAGPRDTNPMIHIPAGVRNLLHHPVVNWNFAAEPEPTTGNRPMNSGIIPKRTRSSMPTAWI